jgi:(1->4)-alpha-D-glucan 1-alpha-D-glucosylmutase
MAYVHLEKILGEQEPPPRFEDKLKRCPHHGTTGYEYLMLLRSLLVDKHGYDRWRELYADFTKKRIPEFGDAITKAKELMARHAMPDEFDQRAKQFRNFLHDEHGQPQRRYKDYSPFVIRRALETLATELDVYRVYPKEDGSLTAEDKSRLDKAFNAAFARTEEPSVVISLLQEFFDPTKDGLTGREREQRLDFLRRWCTLTSPVQATGVENTAWYRLYHYPFPLLDVGGHPDHGPASPRELHALAKFYAQHYPFTMIPASTHDTKMNENVAARGIAMLWSIDKFERCLHLLDNTSRRHTGNALKFTLVMAITASRMTEEEKERAEDAFIADPESMWSLLRPADKSIEAIKAEAKEVESEFFKHPAAVRFLCYQRILSSIPSNFLALAAQDRKGYVQRIQADVVKSLKEGKEEASWISPYPDKLNAVRYFAALVLNDVEALNIIGSYCTVLEPLAARACIAWSVLRMGGLPGRPDIYQGTEVHSNRYLVDPDNRSEVDYGYLQKLLEQCVAMEKLPEGRTDFLRMIRDNPGSDLAKMFFTWRGAAVQKDYEHLFIKGAYMPLEIANLWDQADERHLAFIRQDDENCVLTVAPLRGYTAVSGEYLILAPEYEGTCFENLYTGVQFKAKVDDSGRVVLDLFKIYGGLPGATLKRVPATA